MTTIIDSRAPAERPSLHHHLNRPYAVLRKFILMRSPRLGAADQLKLDRQLFTTLTERTPYWLTIVSIGLIGVAIAGKFEAVGWPNGWLDGIFTSKNVWIAFVLLSALPYIPLM